MKRSKFSEEQIVYAIRQAESGTPVGDRCRQLGVSDATFYAWKKKYAHLGVSELRRLRQLEEENSRLKKTWRERRKTHGASCRCASREDLLVLMGFGLLAKSRTVGSRCGSSWVAHTPSLNTLAQVIVTQHVPVGLV